MSNVLRISAAMCTLASCSALIPLANRSDQDALGSIAVAAAIAAAFGACLGVALSIMPFVVRWQYTWPCLPIIAGFSMLDTDRRDDIALWALATMSLALVPMLATHLFTRLSRTAAVSSLVGFGMTYIAAAFGLWVFGYPFLLIPYGLWLLAAAADLDDGFDDGLDDGLEHWRNG